MDAIDFFSGRRALTSIYFEFYKGKASLKCTPWEEWKLIDPCPFSIRCGNSRNEKLSFRSGFQDIDRTSTESTLGASIGEKGIAAIESSLKQTISKEIVFQVGIERERSFTFDSPKCGHKVVRLYQLTRSIHFAYEDKRFWHRDAWEDTIIQWLSPVYDATYVKKYDSNCNCKSKISQQIREGIPARIVFYGISKLAVQWQDNGKFEFADCNNQVDSFFIGRNVVLEELPTSSIPDYLLFLSNINTSKTVSAKVLPVSVFYTGASIFPSTAKVTIEFDEDFNCINHSVEDSSNLLSELYFQDLTRKKSEAEDEEESGLTS